MIERLRSHKLFLGTGLVIMLIVSVYIACIISAAWQGYGISYNPITILIHVKDIGFPFSGSLILFFIFIALTAFIIWRSELRKNRSAFKCRRDHTRTA